jgi:hypothetical protein
VSLNLISKFQANVNIFHFSAIGWKKNNSSCFIPWDKIVVQAIQAEPQRSIYLMIDESWENEAQDPVLPVQNNENGNGAHHEGENEEEGSDCEDADEEQTMTEFWLIPENPDEIDDVYYVMTRCGNSNNMEEESEEDEEFLQGEDMGQMNINDGNDDDERFADAE